MEPIPIDLLTQAAQGDLEAFERLYKATSGFVYNVAMKITRNNADAEEVTQDVFMKIYHGLKDFQFRSSFRTWVYRITVNMAINRYHRSAREKKGRVEYDDISIESFPSAHSTREEVVGRESAGRLTVLLDTLTPEHRACVLLREIEGLSYEEIAGALRVPLNTVRSRLKRARQALLEQARKAQVRNEL